MYHFLPADKKYWKNSWKSNAIPFSETWQGQGPFAQTMFACLFDRRFLFFFKGSFRFAVQLRGRYRDFSYTFHPHTFTFIMFPTISHQGDTVFYKKKNWKFLFNLKSLQAIWGCLHFHCGIHFFLLNGRKLKNNWKYLKTTNSWLLVGGGV